MTLYQNTTSYGNSTSSCVISHGNYICNNNSEICRDLNKVKKLLYKKYNNHYIEQSRLLLLFNNKQISYSTYTNCIKWLNN